MACKDAIIQFASEHCCYGSKPAKEMSINKFEGITALHVSTSHILEIFSSVHPALQCSRISAIAEVHSLILGGVSHKLHTKFLSLFSVVT